MNNTTINIEEPPLLIHAPLYSEYLNHRKTPITIITGFLGSGKTTLLNHVLCAPHGKRIAVVLNEFGDSMNIERQMIAATRSSSSSSATADTDLASDATQQPLFEEWLELRNGCICCSMKDAGVKAIENLMRNKGRFDYILLETTGLADPGPVASMFWLDQELQADIYLDSVVTVVDAKNAFPPARQSMEAGGVEVEENLLLEFERQLAVADRIILNKIDLLPTEADRQALINRLRAVNALAPIMAVERAAVPMDFLLDIHAYSDEAEMQQPEKFASGLADVHSVGERSAPFISTICVILPSNNSTDGSLVSKDRFERWLESLLWEHRIPGLDRQSQQHAIEVVRFKALLHFQSTTWVYQSVGALYDSRQIETPTTDGDNRLVFIGRNLASVDELRDSLLAHA